jgi:pimeloyl-ACP methyl ester carboxylesterase
MSSSATTLHAQVLPSCRRGGAASVSRRLAIYREVSTEVRHRDEPSGDSQAGLMVDNLSVGDLVVREYGGGAEVIITLHGGPAAAGDVGPLARELGKRWRVFEPHQRGSGATSLSVATHVQDLHDLIEERTRGSHPILVGHSWGAMLALAYAARHPARAAGLVLIGCGTFSLIARQEFERRLDAKLTPRDRADIERLERYEPDENRQLAMVGHVMTRVYGYDVEEIAMDVDVLDAQAHEQTWADMVKLQRDGVYPAAFAAIDVPVLMLHGDVDPHPGSLIAEDLRKYIPHLEYLELAKCGHSPWLERQAKRRFFSSLEAWMGARTHKAE